MWNPVKIEIYNLFAHKESIYNFKNNTCTVIWGKNETDKGLENNGAGKTTLFEAICIALTNESLRNIKKDSFINRNEENCKIIFELHNPVLKQKLKIIREFYRGNKPVKVEIWENDKINTQTVSVLEANKRVLDLIGISKDDLLRYYLISQDNRYTFFTSSDIEKKEIMNRITSADIINPLIEELDLRFKLKTADSNVILNDVAKVTDRIDLLLEQKAELLASDNSQEEVNRKEKSIKEIEEEILEIKQDIKSKYLTVKRKTAELDSLVLINDETLNQKITNLLKEVENIENDLTEAKGMKRKLQSELTEVISCPNCNHEFVHNFELNLSVKEINQTLKEVESLIKKENENLINQKEKLDKLRNKRKKSEEVKKEHEEIKYFIDSVKRKIKNLEEQENYNNTKISKILKEISEIKKAKKDNSILKSINLRIEESEKEIKELNQKLIPVQKELDLIKYWQFNMGKSGFITYLANKSIKVIEGVTNNFLKKFGVDISVLINGFTVLKSGEVREKIDVFISNNGSDAELFMAKSGGERGRVTLAGILAIQNLINLSANGKGLNLLCFDECFHGMDSRGQENIIKIFEKIGMTILVITQNVSESFNNENTLYVVKKNDISKYI